MQPQVGDIWLYEDTFPHNKGHLFILSEDFDKHYGTMYTILCLETGLIDKFTKKDLITSDWKKVA